ncbi:MAG: GNAT family N-acetyltransferase [Nitrospinota bacterium]|nr:GNAT family N-acetyltransferase [Nitrospinota bacterium]
MELDFRKAKEGDCRLLFEWANDPVVRRSSFNSVAIEYDDHVRWFNGKLHDASARLLLFYDDEAPAGLARFEKGEAGIEIHFTVAPEYRGRGVGTEIIQIGVEYCKTEWPGEKLVAHVKDDNEASIKIFERAGFINDGYVQFKGGKCLRFSVVLNG